LQSKIPNNSELVEKLRIELQKKDQELQSAEHQELQKKGQEVEDKDEEIKVRFTQSQWY
jgi:hypothetical protein